MSVATETVLQGKDEKQEDDSRNDLSVCGRYLIDDETHEFRYFQTLSDSPSRSSGDGSASVPGCSAVRCTFTEDCWMSSAGVRALASSVLPGLSSCDSVWSVSAAFASSVVGRFALRFPRRS